MKLYHFTALELVRPIKLFGLDRGVIPLLDADGNLLKLDGPYQWLTDDPSFDRQSWATRNVISIDRTEARLTIRIPKTSRDKLARAHDLLPTFPEGTKKIILDWPGSEHWYLFAGRIPRGWIREVVYKEVPHELHD